MEWAVLGLFIMFVIVTYIVVQGTRAALAWRKAAAEGDVKVIRDIVEDSLGAWRSMKRPKEVSPDVWRGIQGMQIVEVDAELVRVSCQAEGDYRLVNGPDRVTERVCILSTTASREDARQVDWEEWTTAQIVEALGGRYRMDDLGQPLPIEVEAPKSVEAEDAGAPPAPSRR